MILRKSELCALTLVAALTFASACTGSEQPEIIEGIATIKGDTWQTSPLEPVPSGNFLGTEALVISAAAWEPQFNKLEPQDTSIGEVHKDFSHDAAAEGTYRIQSGTSATAGCGDQTFVDSYVWIRLDADGKVIEETSVPAGGVFQASAGSKYILRATLSNLAVCQFVAYSFMVLKN